MTEQRTCIWCQGDTSSDATVEHIVPEAIGCPPDFVLRDGEVCRACNNGLAHLDLALVADLEMYAFLVGVPRKGGRPPGVFSYGNMAAETVGGRSHIHFNMDRGRVSTKSGRVISGFRGQARDVRATYAPDIASAAVTFSITFGESPKVARALTKLAVEWVCHRLGPHIARGVVMSPVGTFVLTGAPVRPILLAKPDNFRIYQHTFEHIHFGPRGHLACEFRLGHMIVMIDLDPELHAARAAYAEALAAHGPQGFTTLPVGWKPE